MQPHNFPAPAAGPSAGLGITILDEIETFMGRFIAFPDPQQSRVIAAWILHTHAFDAAVSTPYLYVTSAEKQSGKTRVIETVNMLVRNPLSAANVSASGLFRSIDATRPTVFIDEVDAIFSGHANEDLRGVLNSGYKHNGSVLRTLPGHPAADPDTGMVNMRTFCPKLLAGIDNAKMPDTIGDRCIRIVLKRKRKDQEVERMIPRRVEPEAEALRDRIKHWAEHNIERVMVHEPVVIEEISDRAYEISEPLLQCAYTVSHVKGDELRAALTNLLAVEGSPLSLAGQVLKAAREIMDAGDHDRISSAALADAMQMTAKRVGVLLAPYGIRPTTLAFGGQKMKGYFRRDFQDAWERYL